MQGKQIGGHGSGQAGSDGGVDEDGSDGEKGHNRPCLFIRLCGCELGAHLVPPLLAQDTPCGLAPNPPPKRAVSCRLLGLCAFWFLNGPCFPRSKLFSLAPKEVFFSSEWVRRMTEPSLICSCSR